MKKKIYYTFILLLSFYSLFSFTEKEKKLLEQNFFKKIEKKIPINRPVLLKVTANNYSSEIEGLLKSFLLKKGYKLLLTKEADCDMLNFRFKILGDNTEKDKLFSKVTIKRKNFEMNFELTSTGSNRILEFESLKFTNIEKNKVNKFKWYDPIMVTAITGGIVYLFYNGG